ncbi:MAG: hypothetical protein JSU87_07330 [Gemmatimonadota bacterium]|nr:MAG: hypothetical protein JSU87_07330 [Gemmatimonadota bacterium]
MSRTGQLRSIAMMAGAALCLVSCSEGRAIATSGGAAQRGVSAAPDSSFAKLIERLSEPDRYFDTDNLISNETSYLHVVSKLKELGVRGRAYISVGPDQNFSYIASIRPNIAFIVDIRHDNLLQQLMFKALFALASNRLEYLCLLHGRPPPTDAEGWRDRSIEDLVDYVDGASGDPELATAVLDAVAEKVASYGYPLDSTDLVKIRRFHLEFIREGLGLRFRSHGRRPRPHYPTYRQLLLERDLSGRRASYLATEDDFQYVKSLQESHLVIPVVGDLAGDHALRAIGRYLAERSEIVSAFYTSNVEYYIMRQGAFQPYVRNLSELPHTENSLIIRSFFGRNFGYVHPQAVPGYFSVQLLQTIGSLLTQAGAGGYGSYLELVSKNQIDLAVRERAAGQ